LISLTKTIFGHEFPGCPDERDTCAESRGWLSGVIRRTQDTRRSVNGYRYSAPFEARTVAVITQTK
jgi:hypothetical protein